MTDEQRTTPSSMDLRAVPPEVIAEVRRRADIEGIGPGLAVQVRWVLTQWFKAVQK